jgi:hypothetical protein
LKFLQISIHRDIFDFKICKVMLHLPELAEVGTRGFARGIEDGAASLPGRPIDSDRVTDRPTGYATVGLKT